ncbi:hypothetical protein BSR29_03180 [Boudabousia liubingyangii]|uniref:Major facilitator superfamily (MFS) profile domain-containing protein n=1 Tax=Boudabousia liubingyangii TaxID=1921764 RepID=A0A1Q5PN50_9ACTO|nr:MFS transporter [Boudabousia liubingyangii]OKL48870.1 hypothetical protein BSR29_03180 [Boudabousia liubingyangii]
METKTKPTNVVDKSQDPNRFKSLGVLALAVSLIVIDGTIVNVALPTMIADLPLTFTEAQWVTTVYNLIFAALLITTGRLGDTYGRRNMLYIGITLFALGSVAAGLAGGADSLIAARFLQGIGGAFVLPATLSTVNATFRGRERAMAFGIWGATISGAAALGPLLGGWLTGSFSWRWIFGINIPLAALIALGAFLWVPQTKEIDELNEAELANYQKLSFANFDYLGFIFSGIGMGATVFGLVEGRSLGWWSAKAGTWAEGWSISPAALGLIIGVISLIAFVNLEAQRVAHGRNVLLDVTLFKLTTFTWGNIAAMVVAMGEFGLLFVLPLYLQNVLGLTPIRAGWVLAVMAIGAFISGGLAGPLARKITAAKTAMLGLVLEAIGIALVAVIITPETATWLIDLPLVIYGAGLGLASAQLTSTILVDVPAAKSGQGSATQSTVRQLGSALGVAVIATIMASSVGAHAEGALSEVTNLPPQAKTVMEQSLAPSAGSILMSLREGNGRAAQLDPQTRELVTQKLSEAFVSGSTVPLWVGAGFMLLGVGATSQLVRANRKRTEK